MQNIVSNSKGFEEKVTIILVNYNSVEDTLECIRSLQKIDYTNYRIIVVDNASSDDLRELQSLCDKNEIVLLRAGDNLGFAGGNNLGIRYALEHEKTDYVLLLNNDTVVKKDFLSLLVREAKCDATAGIICGTILRFDSPEEIWYKGGEILIDKGDTCHFGYGKKNSEYAVKKKYVSFATGCLWLMPKTTVEKIGFLTEDYFLYAEDSDYCCRVLNEGLRILFVPEAVIWHKVGRSSKVSDIMQYYMVRNDFLMFSRFAAPKKRKWIEVRILLRRIKDVCRGRISFRALRWGYKDYHKNVLGKIK